MVTSLELLWEKMLEIREFVSSYIFFLDFFTSYLLYFFSRLYSYVEVGEFALQMVQSNRAVHREFLLTTLWGYVNYPLL